MSRRFPLYVDLTDCAVLVYGGGTIAARRCRVLSDFGARLTVIAPEIRPEIQSLPGVQCRFERFSPEKMPKAALVLAAAGDPAVNRAIAAAARARGVPVNNASARDDCDFHFPAIAARGPLVVGVNAGGEDHRLVARAAAAIRRLLEKEEL